MRKIQQTVEIKIDDKVLDEALEKANQLIDHLQKIKQIAGSLSGKEGSDTKPQESVKSEEVDVFVIKTEEGKLLMMVGNEMIEISDFTTRSSAYGETELLVTIKGGTVSTELLANSKKIDVTGLAIHEFR